MCQIEELQSSKCLLDTSLNLRRIVDWSRAPHKSGVVNSITGSHRASEIRLEFCLLGSKHTSRPAQKRPLKRVIGLGWSNGGASTKK
jgi:hypothetical protein